MPKPHAVLNLSAGLASVSVALVLVALKLWALSATSSLSVAASLADSALDLMISGMSLMAILYAARPPDEDHAFGHTSVEDLAALSQGILVLLSAIAIGYSAGARLWAAEPASLTAEGPGIIAMTASIALTLVLVAWQRHVARKTGNRVVAADSLHYLSDLLPSAGAIIALWASHSLGLPQIDSFIALAAALMLALMALRIGTSAWDALMDRSADPKLVASIAQMAGSWPGVQGYHDLKTRTAGSRVFVNLHIELDGDLTLRDAHAISAGLRRHILETHPNCDVLIHKDVAH